MLDTSVFVAREQERPLGGLPAEGRLSVVTLAELRIGVLVASEPSVRAQRMRTLSEVEALEALPVDDDVAREFAEIVAAARQRQRRPKILDSLIAATARALDVPVFTQDADFDEIPGVQVVRV
ncbi:MAG TPA: PIN domain-containing protein [Thermoleophilaceae bacterium]|nr:PIN domain-containing protein [Thermoleophilaceae bacterium]